MVHEIGDLVYHVGGTWGLGYISEKYKASNKKNSHWNYDITWLDVGNGQEFTSRGYSNSNIIAFKAQFNMMQTG